MTFVMCQDEEKNNLFQHKKQQTGLQRLLNG